MSYHHAKCSHVAGSFGEQPVLSAVLGVWSKLIASYYPEPNIVREWPLLSQYYDLAFNYKVFFSSDSDSLMSKDLKSGGSQKECVEQFL